MRSEAYSAILYALAEGIHPVTGDSLPDGLIDQPDVIRALYAGARILETGNQGVRAEKPATESWGPGTGKPDDESPEPEPRKPDDAIQESVTRKPASGKSGDKPDPKPGRENAGKPWSKEDDALLMENYAAGMSVNSLAKTFKRSAFAIEARLEKLENSQPGAQKCAYRIIRPSGEIEALAPLDAPRNPATPKTP